MHARTLFMLAAAIAAMGGCASPSADSESSPVAVLPGDIAERVDRMRGCWIAREGSGAIFLRLLPPSAGAPTIEGGVDRAGATTVERTATLSFARDGSVASFAHAGGPPEIFQHARPAWAPASPDWLVYRSISAPVLFMLVEAPGETLRIMTTLGPDPGPMTLSSIYEANRDGCD